MRAVIAVLTLVVMAGCADTAPEPVQSDEDAPAVEVDDTTGAIRGVVVDQAIVPVEGVTVTLTAAGKTFETTTDKEGQFAFSKVVPGTHIVNASKVQYAGIQVPVTVVAGDADPPMVRLMVERILEGTPSLEMQKYRGHIFCAYDFGISSTCVNDYTRICTVGSPPCCPGGCLPQVTGVVDQREYQSSVSAGWQTIVWELAWEATSAATGEAMGLTVSYKDRDGASHWYASLDSPDPFRLQVDVDVVHPSMQTPEQGDRIDPNGQDDLWNMISSGGGVVLEQDIEVFQSNFMNAPAPEGWSFLAGDENPF